MKRDQLSEMRDLLWWFFALSAPDTGFHGAGLDGDSIGRVFDEHVSHQKHMSLRRPEHHQALAKHSRIKEAMGRLSFETVCDIRCAFTPIGAARLRHRSTRSVFTVGDRQLLGLVLVSEALRAAFAREFRNEADPSITMLLAFVEAIVDKLPGIQRNGRGEIIHTEKGLPSNHKLAGALREADERETAAVQAFAEKYRAVVAEREAQRLEALELELRNHGVRIGLKRAS